MERKKGRLSEQIGGVAMIVLAVVLLIGLLRDGWGDWNPLLYIGFNLVLIAGLGYWGYRFFRGAARGER